MTEQKQRRKPRKYTDEFKQQLVELYRSGKRRCDICREYDIATSLSVSYTHLDNATDNLKRAKKILLNNHAPNQN